MATQKTYLDSLQSQVGHLKDIVTNKLDDKRAALKPVERSAKRALARTANTIRTRPFLTALVALLFGIFFGRVTRSRV